MVYIDNVAYFMCSSETYREAHFPNLIIRGWLPSTERHSETQSEGQIPVVNKFKFY